MMNISQKCNHEFERNKGIDSNKCILCKWYPSREKKGKMQVLICGGMHHMHKKIIKNQRGKR